MERASKRETSMIAAGYGLGCVSVALGQIYAGLSLSAWFVVGAMFATGAFCFLLGDSLSHRKNEKSGAGQEHGRGDGVG